MNSDNVDAKSDAQVSALASDDSPTPEESERSPLTGMTESVLLAAVPAAAYVVTYAFEVGYALRRGFPLEFITVTLPQFLAVAAYLAANVAGYLLALRHLLNSTRTRPRRRDVAVRAAAIAVLPVLITVAIHVTIWRTLLVVVAVAGFLAAARLLVLSRFWSETLFGHMDLSKEAKPTQWAFVIGGTAAVIILTMLAAGTFVAAGQRDFLIVEGSPERVVLRSYGDRLLCAIFDRSSGTPTPEMSIITLDDADVRLRWERVGPFKRLRPIPPAPQTQPGTTPAGETTTAAAR